MNVLRERISTGATVNLYDQIMVHAEVFLTFHPRSLKEVAEWENEDRAKLACETLVRHGILERVVKFQERWYRKKVSK